MRSREEIMVQRNDAVIAGYATEALEDLTLELLLDIRELLQPVNESANANLELIGKLKAKLVDK